jgi:hypothetical protein
VQAIKLVLDYLVYLRIKLYLAREDYAKNTRNGAGDEGGKFLALKLRGDV